MGSPKRLVNQDGGYPTSTGSPSSPLKTDIKRLAIVGIASAITNVVPARYGPESRAAAIPRRAPAIPAPTIEAGTAIHSEIE